MLEIQHRNGALNSGKETQKIEEIGNELTVNCIY